MLCYVMSCYGISSYVIVCMYVCMYVCVKQYIRPTRSETYLICTLTDRYIRELMDQWADRQVDG